VNSYPTLISALLQRPRQRLTAWLALIAVLLNAFAPVASHAMMAKSGKSLVEICTAQGFKLVEVESDRSSPQTPAKPGIKVAHECAACAAASAPPSPPIDFVSSLVLPAMGNRSIVVTGATFAFASALRTHAPPTGPPSLLV
jgi:hypothetical protein